MVGQMLMWCQAHPLDTVGLMAALAGIVGMVTLGPDLREQISRHHWR